MSTDVKPVRWQRGVLIACCIVLVILVSLASGLAFGFFFLPIILLFGACWLFYWIMAHQKVRNPLHPPRATTAERYTDGQPLGRAVEHEDEVLDLRRERSQYRAAAEADLAADDRNAAREAEHNDPADYEGPPPVNPFP